MHNSEARNPYDLYPIFEKGIFFKSQLICILDILKMKFIGCLTKLMSQ